MRNISPGDAVHPGQTDQRLVGQFRQLSVVAARNAFLDLLELCFNQVKIVQQPVGRRCDVLAALREGGNVVVGLAQRCNIVLNAREKRQAFAPALAGAHGLRLSQAASMLLKALCAKQLGANNRLWPTRVGGQYFPGVVTEGVEPVECGRCHILKQCRQAPSPMQLERQT